MTNAFDQHGINHMVAAISHEMTPAGARRHPNGETLFMGGGKPSDSDQNELGLFAMRKNYRIVFPFFDTARPNDGPAGFNVIVTDGIEQTFVLFDGRLWKRDRRSPAVLVFPGIGAVVGISGKGRMVVRETKGALHDHGYDLARDAVAAGAARRPGRAPVVSWIGDLTTVLDMQAMADSFAQAA